MVRTQRSSFEFLHLEQSPDAGRIAGTSAAIAIHIIALMVLLAPMAAPPVVERQERIRVPVDLSRKELPPVPPVLTPVVRPPVAKRAQPPVQPVSPETRVANNEVLVDEGTLAAATTPDAVEPFIGDAEIAVPLAGAYLQYGTAPPPVYPRAALRDRLTGTVTLQVLVDIDGRPLEVTVAHSSGHRELDRAALDHVLKRWTFRPAMKDGKAVQAMGLVPIAFNLR